MFCFPNMCHCVHCLCSTMVLPECCLEGFVVQWAHTKTVRPSDVRKALRMIMSHHLLILVFRISSHKKLIRNPTSLAAHNLLDEIILLFVDLLYNSLSFASRTEADCSVGPGPQIPKQHQRPLPRV